MNSENKNCIIYSAYKENHIRVAIKSMRNLAKIMPKNFDLIFHTDRKCDVDLSFVKKIIIDEHKNEKDHEFKLVGMIKAMEELDYEKFLFLDNDTLVLKQEAFQIPFQMLDYFDILVVRCGVHLAESSLEIKTISTLQNIPDDFSEINTGVLYFRKNEKTKVFFKSWLKFYLSKYKSHRDQGAFRYLLYFSNLRFYELPNKYNHRNYRRTDSVIIHHNHKVINELR
jgi:hypothetical protein